MITFDVNNAGILSFEQEDHDSDVIVHRSQNGIIVYGNSIPAADMVMLYNLYRYIKDNDIQNDFINPNGANKDEQ